MRLLALLTIGSVLLTSGCSKTPQEKAITIVNAAAVDAPLLERVRAFAERELHVPVRTLDLRYFESAFGILQKKRPAGEGQKPQLAGRKNFPRHSLARTSGWQAVEKAAKRGKTEADVTLIVLAGINDDPKHLAVYPDSGIAVINTLPLYTDEEEVFARRMERQVMRAAAFSFGLAPTPDPFCVTRDYISLEDLDSMGRNFSPPWQGRFAEEAEKRGLIPSNVGSEKAGAE